jgi:hypothetical protein
MNSEPNEAVMLKALESDESAARYIRIQRAITWNGVIKLGAERVSVLIIGMSLLSVFGVMNGPLLIRYFLATEGSVTCSKVRMHKQGVKHAGRTMFIRIVIDKNHGKEEDRGGR